MNEFPNMGLVINPIPDYAQDFMNILKKHNVNFTDDYIDGRAIVYLDPANTPEIVYKAHLLNSAFDRCSAWVPLPLNFADVDLAIIAMRKHGLKCVAIRRVWWSRRQRVLVEGERRLVELFKLAASIITVAEHKEIVDNFSGVETMDEREDRDY